jgi:hypothetical protein
MTILPPVVLTTAQLVGGLVASAKNALDLAKTSSDHALKASISELYDSLLDVKGRVLDLDEENRSLKAQLAREDSIIGPDETLGYFYFKEKMDQPLCPKCFQSQPRNAVFLEPLFTTTTGQKYRRCTVCGWTKWESQGLPTPTRISRAQLHNGQF